MSINNALKHALLSSFEQYKRQLQGKRIWLACSGGRDSLSLAHLCKQLFNAGQLPFLPQLLHVNHGMQSANAAWAQQVSTWAEQNHFPCQVLEINLRQKTENEARRARYEAMISVMNHGDVLILGHHQDDQVETLLMRLFSGAGVNGLGGMKDWSAKQSRTEDCVNRKNIYLWRPLLAVSREQITQYANHEQLSYIDDPTNIAAEDSESGTEQSELSKELNDRAWLRSVLLPRITERYPKAKQAMARTSQLMQEAHSILREQSASDLSQVLLTDNLCCSVVDLTQLRVLPTARQSAIIHSWLAPTDAELPPSKRLVDQVLALAKREDTDHQTCLYWDSGIYQYQIRRYQDKLYRLLDSFDDWLQLPPQAQVIELTTEPAAVITERVTLNQSEAHFEWQLMGLSKLIPIINQQLINQQLINKQGSMSGTEFNNNGDTSALKLIFQPLPRDLKLTLAGRVGRKSGKKLLQAIQQPSFMRESVVLCCLSMSDKAEPLPLFLISLDKLVVLQHQFAQQIENLIKNEELTTQLFCPS